MKDSLRNIILLSMALVLISCCGKPQQDSEPLDDEPTPVSVETEAPSPEPTSFDMSSIKWIVLGDSITEKNSATEISYYDFVQKDFQCEVVKYG